MESHQRTIRSKINEGPSRSFGQDPGLSMHRAQWRYHAYRSLFNNHWLPSQIPLRFGVPRAIESTFQEAVFLLLIPCHLSASSDVLGESNQHAL